MRWQPTFQRRTFTTIAQSYIINIMSVNSWWKPVFKQICGEKTFQELRMLSPAWLALGLRMGAIAEFLHDPHPTPQEFMCHFGVGTYAAGTSASEYFVISPPYFPYICGSIFLKCGSISSTFPCKPEFFYFFTLSNCSLFCCVLEHCVTLRSKDKTKNMWNMWKGIHSSFKPEQAHRHHRGEKPLIGPNLCQLWLQFDHNVSIEKARDGAHCIGPTQRPIRKTFFFLMLFPVYKR